MKALKNTLTLFALLAVFSTAAFAQQTGNAPVNVAANVVAGISVTNAANIDFGTITIGETATAAVNTADAGAVLVTSGVSGAAFDISATFPSELTGGAGTILLRAPATSDVLVKDGSGGDSTTGTSSLTNPTVSSQTVSGEFTASGTDFNVFVGAEIVDSSGAEAGTSHTGTITVTVSYQ